MCPIPVIFPSEIRSYWYLTTIVIHNITSRQSVLSLIINRRSIKQGRHVKPLVEVLVEMARNSNARITIKIGRAIRKNPMEGIIVEDVITLKMVFKRG